MIQLVLLTALAGDTTSLAAGTLINTDEPTARKLLDNTLARKLLKHEPTEEQLSKSASFSDHVEPVTDSELDEEGDDSDSNTDPLADPNARRTRRKKPTDA
jgi:hypothetical protein